MSMALSGPSLKPARTPTPADPEPKMNTLAERETSVWLSEPVIRLGRDIRKASTILSQREARWLIDTYYQMQDGRIRAKSQLDRQKEATEPNELINWVFGSWRIFEGSVKASLGEFAANYKVGQWLQAQYGIGPVLSACMLAHFDIRKAPTVGHFWSFSGLNPTVVWKKKEKRPWNAALKSIVVFRMGECFVKFQNRENCYYGQLLAGKKADLTAANEVKAFANFAVKEIKRYQDNKALLAKMQKTERWKYWNDGRLCPQNIHDRARRWTVKLFLSHLHEVMHYDYFGKAPPAPFIFQHPELGDHRHKLEPQLYPGDYDGKSLKQLYREK